VSDPSARLRRLIGGPDTAWLVERVRRRMELGKPLTGVVTLNPATAEQRRAAETLLGRRPASGTSLAISLPEVDGVLRRSGACADGLAAAVERLTGAVTPRADEEARRAAAWRAAHAELDAVVAGRPELAEWRTWLDRTGVVRRVAADAAEATRLLGDVARVLRRLPSPGVPIGRLAGEACRDAHALDDGRPVGTLALSAVRALSGVNDGGSADTRRRAWAAVGVHLDDLSSLALCAGLPGDGATPLGRSLALARDAGEPCMLTLRQLRRHDAASRPGPDVVHICENPVVVAAAADELGPRCPPLVCVHGHPSAAVRTLLDLLADSGARFAYHGDFDWGGVTIAAAVYDRYGWTPWRFDAAAYRSAPGGTALTGRVCPTPWDPALATAMTERGVRVEEELVLDDLLADLGA
jgi:uncharacterized protein (TIGR02679 family)